MKSARAARESVLVVPASDRAAIVVSGKDRTSWLNGLVTQDLLKLAPGAATYGLLVEKKGRIQTDLYVVPGCGAGAGAAADGSASQLVLAVPSSLRDGLVATLDHYLIMEDAELTTPELSFWFAHGPRAGELTAALSAPYAGTLDLLGTGGAVIAGPEEMGRTIAEAAAALGGALGDDATWNALRIERGIPRFGVEVDTSLYPQEASLETLGVSFQKGCYLGQEVVYMLQERGHVKKRLVGLELADGEAPAQGAEVATPDGVVVGDVRSGAIGPLDGKAVAIAMVKFAESKPGTELRVGGHAARVR
jgi:folate-binding protein YgfZ